MHTEHLLQLPATDEPIEKVESNQPGGQPQNPGVASPGTAVSPTLGRSGSPAVAVSAKTIIANERTSIAERRGGAQQPPRAARLHLALPQHRRELRRVVMPRADPVLAKVYHEPERVAHDEQRQRAGHRAHGPQEPALVLLARALGHALEEPRLHLGAPALAVALER